MATMEIRSLVEQLKNIVALLQHLQDRRATGVTLTNRWVVTILRPLSVENNRRFAPGPMDGHFQHRSRS